MRPSIDNTVGAVGDAPLFHDIGIGLDDFARAKFRRFEDRFRPGIPELLGSVPWMSWNCTSNTRGFDHSPSFPYAISPTIVLNEWLRI